MGWINEFKKKYGKDKIKPVPGTPRVSSKSPHPRELVIQNIKNSISYLSDPKFVVKRGKKTAAPDLCYQALDDDRYEIYAKYARVRLKLDGDDEAVQVAKDDLEPALQGLIEGLENKEYDAQLDELRKKFKQRAAGRAKRTSKK